MDPRRQSFDSLLDDVASPTPAPGGGSVAGCACALAAALVEMAARIELGRAGSAPGASTEPPLPARLPQRVRALRELALELAERELSSYEPVLAAKRLAADDASKAARVERALVDASETPLALAEAAAEVAELGASVAAAAAFSVRGDAVAGVILAEAAAAAAAELVGINLAGGPAGAGDLLDRARAARDRAAAARASAC